MSPDFKPKELNKVCFTGFTDTEEAELKALAQKAGMNVVGAVSRLVGVVVAGSKAGPKKIRLAEEYGAKIATKEAFLKMIEAGTALESIEERAAIEESLKIGDRLYMPPGVFVAIDFETADHKPDSACAVGAVRIEDGLVAAEEYRLIRPPREKVYNTHIHGFDWKALKDHPPFPEIWAVLSGIMDGAEYFIAHSAFFDRRILTACCGAFIGTAPDAHFLCTLRGAKAAFGSGAYPLSSLCERFSIPLRHHHALSDAKAAVRVCEKLFEHGVDIDDMTVNPISENELKAVCGCATPNKDKTEAEALSEIRTIAKSLICDDVLTEGEFNYLCRWLTEHDHLSESKHFRPLFEMAASILADGIVTQDELEQMNEFLVDFD